MNIKELLEEGKRILKQNEDASLICKILLADLLGENKQYLIINQEEQVISDIQEQYLQNIIKIQKGYPMQYIINYQEFMKLDFYVDENVLIPRPDTEVLVEEILKIAKPSEIKILDLCTGSGAIGISLAKYLSQAQVYMVDISEKALKIARKNAQTNKVEEQIKFIHSNMYQNIPNIQFDIIVSNPPYIETDEIKKLDKQVQNEPIIALDGGEDGLDFYKVIVNESFKFLKKEGILALEIGYTQKEKINDLLESVSQYKDIINKKDLAGNDRIVIAKRR